MKRMTKRERSDLGAALLQRRCIPGVPLPLEDIAAWMGISRERVRQIQENGLRKIRLRLLYSGPEMRQLWDALMMELFERREIAEKKDRE